MGCPTFERDSEVPVGDAIMKDGPHDGEEQQCRAAAGSAAAIAAPKKRKGRLRELLEKAEGDGCAPFSPVLMDELLGRR